MVVATFPGDLSGRMGRFASLTLGRKIAVVEIEDHGRPFAPAKQPLDQRRPNRKKSPYI